MYARPSADLDGVGSAFATGFGVKPVKSRDVPPRRYLGSGTVIAAFSTANRRDHPVRLSVPEENRARLARSGAIAARAVGDT